MPGLQVADITRYAIGRYLKRREAIVAETATAFDTINMEMLPGLNGRVQCRLNQENAIGQTSPSDAGSLDAEKGAPCGAATTSKRCRPNSVEASTRAERGQAHRSTAMLPYDQKSIIWHPSQSIAPWREDPFPDVHAACSALRNQTLIQLRLFGSDWPIAESSAFRIAPAEADIRLPLMPQLSGLRAAQRAETNASRTQIVA